MLGPILSFWRMPRFHGFPVLSDYASFFSPQSVNPLNLNPLRDLLDELVDFKMVRANDGLKLFVAATNVRNGKIKIFSGQEITADAVMASACLPYAFRPVEIDNEVYWDGGYSGNPALFPFFTETMCEDTLLVQVNPIRREEIPSTAHEIMERISEITFNSSLLREFRAIDFVNRMIDEKRLDGTHYRRNRLHRIDAATALSEYTASSKLDTSWSFFQALYVAGRTAAEEWLTLHYADIGVKATLDLRAEFM